MKEFILGVVIVLLAVGGISMFPDFLRYMKIRSM